MKLRQLALWTTAAFFISCAVAGSYAAASGPEGFIDAFRTPRNDTGITTIDQTQSIPQEGIRNLTVSVTAAAVRVVPTDATDIRAHLTGTAQNGGDIRLVPTRNGDTWDLKVDHDTFHDIRILLSVAEIKNLKLDIEVPRTFAGAMEIRTVSGPLDAETGKLSALTLKTTSGRISASVQTDILKVSSVSGSLDLRGTAARGEIHTTSGRVTSSLASPDIRLSTTSGTLSLTGLTGALDAESVSGSISASWDKLTNNAVAMKTTSGRLSLALPEGSAFRYSFRSTSGRLTNGFDSQQNGSPKDLTGQAGQGGPEIRLRSVSGSAAITKKN